MTQNTLKWSCDERDRSHCRNPHGCHCREITDLMHSRDYYRREMENWKKIRRTADAIAARPTGDQK